MTRTYTPKAGETQREWLVIDATDVVLGRLASHAAQQPKTYTFDQVAQ